MGLLIILLVLVSVIVVITATSNEVTRAKCAYNNFLKNNKYEEYFTFIDIKDINFCVLDLDQDGLEELIVANVDFDGWITFVVFQYIGGKVNIASDEIYCLGSPRYNNSNKELIYMPFREENFYVNKFENGELKLISRFYSYRLYTDLSGNNIYERGLIRFTGNEGKHTYITEEEYNSYYNKHLHEAISIEIFKNTKQNRKLYLK